MTDFILTKEILDLTAKEHPTIPKHMIKLIYDFDRLNPTYLEDHPEIFNKSFNPEMFSKQVEESVGVLNPEDLPEPTYAEGVEPQPIHGLTEEEYNEQLEALKKEELKKDLEDEKNNVGN
tara:strand:+ start:496 stop:855 length:360 start_codon:yes stop_codon:yes gene_type:complete